MNNEQEEIQFLGFIGILSESCNIVSSRKKLFSQITLSLILPLSFIHLAQIQMEHIRLGKFMRNVYILEHAPEGTLSYNKISNISSSELTTHFLFQLGYLVFVLILALLSTSAVVYTIACIYTAKDLTFKKVISVVPKVWKRLMVTFLWSFVLVIIYHLVFVFVLSWGILLVGPIRTMEDLRVWVVPYVALMVIYFIGIVYITMIWHLASVVSVLEECYGLKAMVKSQHLIKGKMGVTVAVYVLWGLCFFVVQRMFTSLVVVADEVGNKVGYGLLCLALLSVLMLFGLVAQTVIYFVCKSYHHENIDKSSLSDHLGGYLGEYVPLKTKDVQLEHCEV